MDSVRTNLPTEGFKRRRVLLEARCIGNQKLVEPTENAREYTENCRPIPFPPDCPDATLCTHRFPCDDFPCSAPILDLRPTRVPPNESDYAYAALLSH